MLTVFYSLFLSLAIALFLVGIYWRVRQYLRTPQTFSIPLTPAPTANTGVFRRVLAETILFKTLFKSDRLLWLPAWVFHFSLLLVLLRHLRVFTDWVWPWRVSLWLPGNFIGLLLIASLICLLTLRLVRKRTRYISKPSDYLLLILLLSIVISGYLLSSPANPHMPAIQAFVLGLSSFDWRTLPDETVVLTHLFFAGVFLCVFPMSKLMHAPGIFFSPSLIRKNASRKLTHKRKIGPTVKTEATAASAMQIFEIQSNETQTGETQPPPNTTSEG